MPVPFGISYHQNVYMQPPVQQKSFFVVPNSYIMNVYINLENEKKQIKKNSSILSQWATRIVGDFISVFTKWISCADRKF